MGKKKEPLLNFLKYKYPEKSKDQLYARILCGEVLVNGTVIKNPHMPVEVSSSVNFKAYKKFVSRGGEKLDYILKRWNIETKNKVVLDAGSSTGGFTDCLLKYGARIVYAVDVGYNQLDFSLRNDKRVKVMERTNIMALSRDNLQPLPEFGVMDLSFRSIRRAAYHVLTLLNGDGLISLIKPQFEYMHPQFDFNGIVKTKAEVLRILKSLIGDLKDEGVEVLRIGKSPILGRKGNREYFFYLSLAKQQNKQHLEGGQRVGQRGEPEGGQKGRLQDQVIIELTRIVLE